MHVAERNASKDASLPTNAFEDASAWNAAKVMQVRNASKEMSA
jgi:hypothetical protein